MSIQYPVDVENTRWAVMQISTGQIISRNKTWPRADGSEIVGLDPDYVYLKQVRAAEPQYESRFYRLQATETPDAEANTLTTSFTTVKRAEEEQIAAAENEERAQFLKHFQFEKLQLETAVMVGLITHFAIDGQTIPARFRSRMAAYTNKVKNKVLPNLDRLNAIIADIKAGNEPDLDTGWTDPEA
jgi:hypothetical protein